MKPVNVGGWNPIDSPEKRTTTTAKSADDAWAALRKFYRKMGAQ